LSVASGENWHNFVVHCIENGWFGLENLALIPGSVGAAPIQNIGAYGVELERFCSFVDWFDFSTGKVSRLTNSQCQFDYRHSIFKSALLNRGIITQVGFLLPKDWQPVIQYHGLNDLDEHCSAMDVFNRVVELRTAKLPDPNLTPNAGSFFKNPIIDQEAFALLIAKFPTLVYYPQENNQFKLAAGWLIDNLKLKGFTIGNAMVHLQQALVLVNNGGATGKDIVSLAQHIQKSVAEFYGITIEPEVRLIGANGEQKLHEFKYV
jgi:UDP-N-acetylmuramate dehydrogenase